MVLSLHAIQRKARHSTGPQSEDISVFSQSSCEITFRAGTRRGSPGKRVVTDFLQEEVPSSHFDISGEA